MSAPQLIACVFFAAGIISILCALRARAARKALNRKQYQPEWGGML